MTLHPFRLPQLFVGYTNTTCYFRLFQIFNREKIQRKEMATNRCRKTKSITDQRILTKLGLLLFVSGSSTVPVRPMDETGFKQSLCVKVAHLICLVTR